MVAFRVNVQFGPVFFKFKCMIIYTDCIFIKIPVLKNYGLRGTIKCSTWMALKIEIQLFEN